METDYNLNSDSDDDDEVRSHPNNTANNRNNRNLGNHIHDIERLKAQTTELLDPSWKEIRNRNLLHKMLELEEPTISPKMVEFLLQDGVMETLLQFIVQLGSSPRPTPADARTDDLKYAFKAVVLLTPDEPTDSLLAILSKKASIITRCIFDIFRDDSAGSFYHAYRIIDTLLRCYPAEVYEGLINDGKAIERTESMLRYIGYAPVHEIFVVLIALTPIPRHGPLYTSCMRIRWTYLEQLRDWSLMSHVTDVITKPEEFCYSGSYISAEAHSTAAAQLMLDLIEKLSLEDTGDLLLQPLGYMTLILDQFINAVVDSSSDDNFRRSSCKLICFLLRRAAEPEIICIVNAAPGTPPQQTSILNRLYPLRERIVLHIETKLPEIYNSVSNFKSSTLEGNPENLAVKYSGYSIKLPFTSLRASIVELIVLMVESDEAVAATISVELWKDFMTWTVKYGFNSIYHALFYRLIFAVLRQSQEIAQRCLFLKARLVSFLIDNYTPFPINDSDVPPKTAKEEVLNRHAARGVIMNCLNAIRLQASCQPPSSFLRQHLATHAKWNEFQPILLVDTDLQQRFGMGIQISDTKPQHHNLASLNQLMEAKVEEGGMNHGSRYARSLGFYDDIAWPSDGTESQAFLDTQPTIKSKKKVKKVRRRSSSGASSPSAEIFSKLHPEDTHVPWDITETEDYLEVDEESYPDSDSENRSSIASEDEFSNDSGSDDSGTPESLNVATSPSNGYFLHEKKSAFSPTNISSTQKEEVHPIAESETVVSVDDHEEAEAEQTEVEGENDVL